MTPKQYADLVARETLASERHAATSGNAPSYPVDAWARTPPENPGTHMPQRGTEQEDRDYKHLVSFVRNALLSLPPREVLFDTAPPTGGLYDKFLKGLPAERRGHYECRSCRTFVNRYGGMVIIREDGSRYSPLWQPSITGTFVRSVHEMQTWVERARITGVLDVPADSEYWGHPDDRTAKATAGEFHHLCVKAHAGQPSAVRRAAIREDVSILGRSLSDYDHRTASRTLELLNLGGFPRAEKFLPVARWFVELHNSLGCNTDAVIWRAAALALTGFCHVRSSLIGTILEDVKRGLSFETIRAKYKEKTASLQYQRPQVAPTMGQIRAAEKTVANLGIKMSLARRYASLAEVSKHAMWLPSRGDAAAESIRIFGHLVPKASASKGPLAPPQTMTWVKFVQDVLPSAHSLAYLTQSSPTAYFAFTTAVWQDAPAILQWDRGDNPVNWYLYANGSMSPQWGLQSFVWQNVLGVFPQPSRWKGGYEHLGDGAYLVLNGARDVHSYMAGLALFPETLKSELHGVRAVIEAASKAGRLQGVVGDHAAGVCLQLGKKAEPAMDLMVTSKSGGKYRYLIDRWE